VGGSTKEKESLPMGERKAREREAILGRESASGVEAILKKNNNVL